ncbi:MAG: hypothetical protein AAFN10_12400 [Bacteroidota bacterium]
MSEQTTALPHGEDRKEMLELYKTFLNSIEVTTNRRQQSNQFFIGLLTALLGVVGFVLSSEHLKEAKMIQFSVMLVVGITGLILSGVWREYLKSTLILSKAKFSVLNPMEDKFVVQPFSDEYNLLKEWDYVNLGKLEKILPLLMMIPYALLIFLSFVLLLR